MDDTKTLLAERAKTHGDAERTSAVYAALHQAGSTPPALGRARLSPTQNYALDMIFVKLARILAGNADEVDHWKDIAGYATLVADKLAPASTFSETVEWRESKRIDPALKLWKREMSPFLKEFAEALPKYTYRGVGPLFSWNTRADFEAALAAALKLVNNPNEEPRFYSPAAEAKRLVDTLTALKGSE